MKKQQLPIFVVLLSYAFQACGSDDSDGNPSKSGGTGGAAGGATAGKGGSAAGKAGAGMGSGAASNAGEDPGGNGNAGGGGSGRGGKSGNGGSSANGGSNESGTSNESGSSNGGEATAGAGGEGGAERPLVDTCVFPAASALAGASVPAGYCAYTFATDLSKPRGIVVDENGDLLVSDNGRIVLLHDDDGNGVSDAAERVVLRTQDGLNHGIAINGGFLYASTTTTVYRWPYAGDRQTLGAPEQVVTELPDAGHATRTLQFDAQGRLYVSIGSGGNVDGDSRRARLIRYAASELGSTSTFTDGELFADGLRNEVGLTMDSRGRIWGVENGRDNLERADLGTAIHEDNPGEELNLFLEANAGRFYGYPYCWSEFNLPTTGSGKGTQWADPDNTTHDDAWCKDTTNVIPPALVMQGHSAPLDVEFYSGNSFPADVLGDAIITFHGSWNRTTETGYKVVRVPFGSDGMPSGDPIPLLESANPGDRDSEWPHRPVSLAIGKSGQLFVSSDASGVILAVGHTPN
jgi:glucose/arabinose dehydrogenase